MRVSCSVSQAPCSLHPPASGCWSRKSKIYTNNMLEELDKAWAKRMPATTWQTRLGNVQRQPKEQRPFPLPMYARFAHVCVCVCAVCTLMCVEGMRRCRCGYLLWLNLHLFSKGMFKCATNCVWVEDNAHWGSDESRGMGRVEWGGGRVTGTEP